MTDSSEKTTDDRFLETLEEQFEKVTDSARTTGVALAMTAVAAFGATKTVLGAFFSLTGDAIAEVYAEGKRTSAAARAQKAAAAAKAKPGS